MISVITVTYNNYDDLHRTLSSLEQIDGIERVVVNGGDCEKTKEYLSNFNGKKVPDILLSGDHKKIMEWRNQISIARTKKRRNDLINRT